MLKKLCILFVCPLLCSTLIAQEPISASRVTTQQLQVTQPPLQPAAAPSATVVGAAGQTAYYYWIVARYILGNAAPSPYAVAYGPTNLSSSNYVQVTWNQVPGATGYDVLKTTSPSLPASGNMLLASDVQTTSISDQGATLSAYTLNTFSPGVSMNETAAGIAGFKDTGVGGQLFNVKAYGAYGDGIHDDTLAFNATDTAAQVNGGIIYFPPGTYELDNPQQVNPSQVFSGHNYVSIRCAGASATFIQFTGSNGFLLANVFRPAPYYGVDVSGCTFDLTKASVDAIALHLIDSVGFVIENNGFIGTAGNGDIGVELENATSWDERNQILHNQFYELTSGVELLQDTSDSYNSFGYNIISADHFQIPSGDAGILLTSPSNFTAHFGLYNGRIDARANFDNSATSGSVLSCVNGAQVYNSPIYIGAEGGAGTYDASVDTNSSIAGVGMLLQYTGGTVPTSGAGIYNTLIAGAFYQLIESGSSAPTGACNTGSLFLNSNGTSGSTLYACIAGAWADVK